MMRLGLRICTVLALVGCVTLSSLGQEAKPDAAAEAKAAPAKAATHTVKRERLKIEVNLTGVFEPTQQWPVVLQPDSWSSFTVVKAVAHGTKVKKGDTLVWLDMSDIDEQLQDLEYGMELSKLTQRTAQSGWELLQKTIPLDLKAAERAKRIADEDLSYFMKTNREFLKESAAYSLKSSQESLLYAEEELKQLEKMYNADDLTEETEEIVLTRARNDVERAKFYLKSAELRYKKTIEKDLGREEQTLVEAAQRAEITLAKTTVALPVDHDKQKIDLEKQQLADQRAQEKLNKLRKDREMMAVTAPADGYVYYGKWTRGKWSGSDTVAAQLTEGGKLSAQSVFMTIINPRPMLVRVDVPEKELYRLSPGAQGKAIPEGYPDLELAAKVQQVSPFPVSKGTFDGRVQVALGDDSKAVVPGMGCSVTLVVYDKKDAITVPASAVFEDDADGKRNLVYVARGEGEPEKRKVAIGQKTDEKWEVVQGLNENDEVLLKKPDAS